MEFFPFSTTHGSLPSRFFPCWAENLRLEKSETDVMKVSLLKTFFMRLITGSLTEITTPAEDSY